MNYQQDRDLYNIPPNFLGASTFMGGLFKVRNVIEAGILAAAIGVPVLFLLPYSLTVRIIIVCLTALPLAMLALMGIGGLSLSSFIVIFFKFVRNRRVLGGETAAAKKKTKRQKKPAREKRPPKPKKEKRRRKKGGKYARVEPEKESKQGRSAKAEPQKKQEPPVFLNPVAEYFPIAKIENGIIYTKDHRFVKVVEVIPINFLLRSDREQRNIIYSFVSYLKISPVKVQFKVLTRRADINLHLDTVRREMERETNEQCRLMQEDYLKFVQQISSREAVTRRFFLIFEHEPWGNSRRDEETEAINSLHTAAHTAANYLRQCGNKVIIPENEDEFTVDVLYNLLCRSESAVTPLPTKVKEVAAQRYVQNMDIENIPAADFFAPKEIDFTHGRYLRITMNERYLTVETIRQFEQYLLGEEKSSITIEKYLRDVRTFARFLHGDAVSKEAVVSYKHHLQQRGYAVRSINSMLASVNSLLRYLGWGDCRAKSIRQQRSVYCPEDRELTRGEYLSLLNAAQSKPQLRLLMETICATGIRVSELRYFTVEALRRGEVVIHCKNKTRTILVPGKLKTRLLDFARQNRIAGGAVFISAGGKPLDRCWIWAQMKKLCAAAGVLASKVFPHNLRKLFARTFYGMEKDIAKLADILGHSSIDTTRIYIMTTGQEHRRKMERLGLVI